MPPPPGRRLSPRSRLGPYEILELIGVGGMGEVYRARDARLDRIVAVKVLAASALDSPLARARFEREARAISSLNHPHICAVYDVGHEGDVEYLVMEHLQGEPLSRRLDRRALRHEQVLELAVQIASALAEAHRAGIVHRDLKPGNVMVTPSGAKLLDFGLAKQQEAPAVAPDITPDTVTVEGQLVGTLPYMSPEQVEGRTADTRSDIFSFGAMLHEMLTRQRAFDGSQAHLIASILSSDPPPPSSLQPLCPPELDHLVARCLAKDPALRWQSAQDLLLELKWAVGRTPAVEGPRKRSLRTVAWVAGTAVMAGLVAVFVLRSRQDDPLPTALPRQVTAAPEWESAPAVSPDGGLIAFASEESGHPDIRIVDATGGNAILLTDDPAVDSDPAWFADTTAVAFTSDRGGARAIWKVLRLGGAPSLLVPDARDPALSLDGTRIAFARLGPSGTYRIWVAPLDDPGRATMLTKDTDGPWEHREPAFAPDGRSLCYRAERNLWLISLDGQPARRLTTDGERDVEPAWSADGRHVYFASFRDGSWGLWQVAATGGRPRRVTPGTGGERHPSLSRDGRRLALATYTADAHLGILDLSTGQRGTLRGLGPNPLGPAWAPDGHTIIFSSDRIGGRFDLWVQTVSGLEAAGAPRRLTDHGGNAVHPVVSPDGRWVAYYRVLGEQRDIWIVSATGGSPSRFTEDDAADFHPAWSPDGKRIAFISRRGGPSRVWVAPVADGLPTGPAQVVTRGDTTDQAPAWSPDGKRIAYIGTAAGRTTDVHIVDATGTSADRMVPTEGHAARVAWDRTGRFLFVSGDWSAGITVRKYSAETGERINLDRAVSLGQNPALVDFAVSADGRYLAFARDEVRGDIWALESRDRPY